MPPRVSAIALAILPLVSACANVGCPAAMDVISEFGISLGGFDREPPRGAGPRLASDDNYIVSLGRSSLLAKDAYEYDIVLSRANSQAWITRRGGINGTYEWYGPIAFDAGRFGGCEGHRAECMPVLLMR